MPGPAPFNPARITDCDFITENGETKVQFIAIGDKHKMIRQDDGSIEIIKLPGQGRPYKYGSPFGLENALNLLIPKQNPDHARIAEKIRQSGNA